MANEKKTKKPKPERKLTLRGVEFHFGQKDDEERNCVLATLPGGAQCRVYRQMNFNGGANYLVHDMRGWAVGTADNFGELAGQLAFVDEALAQMWEAEAELVGD